MTAQILQLAGAAAILAAYGGSQLGVLNQRSTQFLIPNLLGAIVLATEAWLVGQYGFLMLEAAWALISARSLIGLRSLQTS